MRIEIDLGGKKWAIFFWINFLWIVGTAALGFMTYQQPAPSGSSQLIETIKIVFLSLGGLGVILPTYLNIFHGIELQKKDNIENTFTLLAEWDNPSLLEARKFLRELYEKKKQFTEEELVGEINSKDNLKQSAVLLMNYFEKVRISLIRSRVDTKIFHNSMGKVFGQVYFVLRPYVVSLGKKDESDWEQLHMLLNQGLTQR